MPKKNPSKRKAGASNETDVEDVPPCLPDIKVEPDGDLSFMEQIKRSRFNCGMSITDFEFNKKRVKVLSSNTKVKETSNGIVYHMFREQRVQDNWCLLYAQRLALKLKVC
jgi:deoxyribodipyrimidine photo-lyase